MHLFIPPTTPDVGPCCLGPRALAGASRPARVPGPLLAPGPCCLGHPTSLRSPPHPRYPASRCPERTREDPRGPGPPAHTSTHHFLHPAAVHLSSRPHPRSPPHLGRHICAGPPEPRARQKPGPPEAGPVSCALAATVTRLNVPPPHPCPSTRGEQHLPARPSIPSRTPRLLPLARYPLHLPAPPARSREITRAAPTPTPSGLSYQLPNKPTSRQADKLASAPTTSCSSSSPPCAQRSPPYPARAPTLGPARLPDSGLSGPPHRLTPGKPRNPPACQAPTLASSSEPGAVSRRQPRPAHPPAPLPLHLFTLPDAPSPRTSTRGEQYLPARVPAPALARSPVYPGVNHQPRRPSSFPATRPRARAR